MSRTCPTCIGNQLTPPRGVAKECPTCRRVYTLAEWLALHLFDRAGEVTDIGVSAESRQCAGCFATLVQLFDNTTGDVLRDTCSTCAGRGEVEVEQPERPEDDDGFAADEELGCADLEERFDRAMEADDA